LHPQKVRRTLLYNRFVRVTTALAKELGRRERIVGFGNAARESEARVGGAEKSTPTQLAVLVRSCYNARRWKQYAFIALPIRE